MFADGPSCFAVSVVPTFGGKRAAWHSGGLFETKPTGAKTNMLRDVSCAAAAVSILCPHF